MGHMARGAGDGMGRAGGAFSHRYVGRGMCTTGVCTHTYLPTCNVQACTTPCIGTQASETAGIIRGPHVCHNNAPLESAGLRPRRRADLSGRQCNATQRSAWGRGPTRPPVRAHAPGHQDGKQQQRDADAGDHHCRQRGVVPFRPPGAALQRHPQQPLRPAAKGGGR